MALSACGGGGGGGGGGSPGGGGGGGGSGTNTATQIATGEGFTCARLDNVTVKCWGLNTHGELGLGDTATRGTASSHMGDALPAIPLGTGRGVIRVTAGANHVCALLDNGSLKCWGHNNNGQLGLGDTANRGDNPNEMGDNLPTVNLGVGRTVTAMAAGLDHTCAILDNSSVKCWGHNILGQLGLGDSNDRGDEANEMGDILPAVDLGSGRTAKALAAGAFHTCAILDTGSVKCWGSGMSVWQGVVLTRGDGPGEMGDNLPVIDLGTGRTATEIAAGGDTTCVRLDNGTVKCWGQNTWGGLGLGDTNHRGDGANEMGNSLPAVQLGAGRVAIQIAVAVAGSHACARLDNDTVKCWGLNSSNAGAVTFGGQLGLGDKNNRGDGPNEMGDNLPAVNVGTGRRVLEVRAGAIHTCARLDNGFIKCWGHGPGALGLGDLVDHGDEPGEMGDNLPYVNLGSSGGSSDPNTGPGATHTVGGTVSGLTGVVYLLNNGVDHRPITANGSFNFSTWLAHGASYNVTVARQPAGQTCQVINGIGAVSGAAVTSIEVTCANTGGGGTRTAVEIATGGGHICARLDNGALKCWGSSSNGQLGLGDVNNRGDNAGEMGDNLPTIDLGTGRTAMVIVANGGHNCARLDNGAMKCWGFNANGRLGLGDVNNRGDNAGEMGDNLPPVDLGSGRTAVKIALGAGLAGGDGHTCAILDNGTVKCWGSNVAGQLGLGDVSDRGDNAGEMGDNLPTIDLGTGRTAVEIEAGAFHTCIRLDNGTVKCWGGNGNGQLGLGDTSNRGDNAGEMGDNLPAIDLGTGRTAVEIAVGRIHTCARLDNGSVKCWGNNNSQLGLGDSTQRGDDPNEMGDNLPAINLGTGRTAVEIEAGGDHTCALLDNGTVKCWGVNNAGQLGLGDTAFRGDNAGEMGDALPAIDLGNSRTAATIAAGAAFVCVILDNSSLKCWGFNGTGQLGLGDINNRGDSAGEMGDNLPAVDLGN